MTDRSDRRPSTQTIPLHWDSDGCRYVRAVDQGNGFRVECREIDNDSDRTEIWASEEQMRGPDGIALAIDRLQAHFPSRKVLLRTNAKRAWRTTKQGRYWLFDTAAKQLVPLGRNADGMLSYAKLCPRGERVAYVCEHDLYCEDLTNGNPERQSRLTHDGSAYRLNGEFDWCQEEGFGCRDGFRWSPDGRRIAFWRIDTEGVPHCAVPRRIDDIGEKPYMLAYAHPGDPMPVSHIGVVEVDSGALVWLPAEMATQSYLPRMQWLDNDTILIQKIDRAQQHFQLWRWHLTQERLDCIYREYDPAWIDVIAYDLVTDRWGMDDLPVAADLSAVFRLSDRNGWRQIVRISLLTRDAEALTPNTFDVARLYGIDRSANILYFSASPECSTQRYLYGMYLNDGNALRRITPLEFRGVNRYEFAPDGRYAVHTFTDRCTPVNHRLVALPQHEAITRTRDGDNNSRDGWRIFFRQLTIETGPARNLQCVLPPAFVPGRRYPVIFVVYGYPMTQQVSDSYPPKWSRLLAELGYIVVASDPVGTPCLNGREWRKQIKHRLGVANREDQAALCHAVLTWPQIDAARAGVFGWSEGGAMALNLMANNPGFFRAGVAVAPIANPLLHYAIYQERYRGLPGADPASYRDGCPQFASTLPTDDILILHGDADDHVHVRHSRDYVRRFAEATHSPRLEIYRGRSHTIDEGELGARPATDAIVGFLSQRIVPGPNGVTVNEDLQAYLADTSGALDAGTKWTR